MTSISGPGPLAYEMKTALGTKGHTLTKDQAPAYSIGLRPPRDESYHTAPSEALPGPSYFYESNITSRGRQMAPAFSLSGRYRQSGVEVTPGPGAYGGDCRAGVLSKENRPRTISMAQRTGVPTHKNDAPPPNSYVIKTGIGSRALSEKLPPSWSMGTKSKFGGTHYGTMKQNTPGPGAYGATEPTVFKKSAGKFSISGRTQHKNYSSVLDNPGPGAYNVQFPKVSGKKGCTMGVKHSLYMMPLICDIDVP
ncbi:hypothetical protein CAPTEDRAFT_127120 [Capitella teleta]|uniref:Outer dense fiber protein 3 n=1 Tax=Capitella teleta TaxID=283909 RepID=R7UG96_CAPTE|nr:hypothetical protein CAPTEDRAFT_127120 [Capitella teleta]|eukprot:ELU05240.1 hypothetical protein CAPTEDRAFT_127120 [Capitella teleta]